MSNAGPVFPWGAVFAGRCPACGQGKLFSGPLSVVPACTECGADFRASELGDGFTVPVLLVLGAVVVSSAAYVDTAYQPPLWVHALIWPPVVALLAIGITRVIKAFLVVQNWRLRQGQ